MSTMSRETHAILRRRRRSGGTVDYNDSKFPNVVSRDSGAKDKEPTHQEEYSCRLIGSTVLSRPTLSRSPLSFAKMMWLVTHRESGPSSGSILIA